MLLIKDNCGNAANALLGPKLLLLPHRVCKPLVTKNSFSFATVQTYFTCNFDQYGIIRQVPPMGEMCGE